MRGVTKHRKSTETFSCNVIFLNVQKLIMYFYIYIYNLKILFSLIEIKQFSMHLKYIIILDIC